MKKVTISLETVVLGAGVAGLVAGFYEKNSTIIGMKPLGQLDLPFTPGPRLIQYNLHTARFVKDVMMGSENSSYTAVTKKAKIGYEENGIVSDIYSDEFKEKYSELTRGKNRTKTSSYMSEGRESVRHIVFVDQNGEEVEESYKFLFKEVLRQLRINNALIEQKVIAIDVTNNTVETEHYIYKYKKLISTLHIDIFRKLLIHNSHLNHVLDMMYMTNKFDLKNKNFWKCTHNKQDLYLKKSYDYIYSVDGIHSRRTFFKDYVVLEVLDKNIAESLIGREIQLQINDVPLQMKYSFEDIHTLLAAPSNIEFIGRYAEWNHKIKLNEVLNKVYARK